ncbi:MAG: FliA/WhiG family RNA polymerase sigma factor [Velocimicrobium sp.]
MDEEGRNKLWVEYTKVKAPGIREKLIIEYAGLVKVVAGRLSMYLGYTVEYDDLVGYGTFGLIDAIDKFDNLKGVKFETYASLRIRGAILDQIRKMDWIPRTLRQKQKKLDVAYNKIEIERGRFATDEEIATELKISVDELTRWQSQTKVANLISLDEFMEQGTEVRMEAVSGEHAHYDQPETVIEKEELKRQLAEVINTLTDNEKKVITFYYYEELTLKEISKVLEVSESRVSQLHTKALSKMKSRLGGSIIVFNG